MGQNSQTAVDDGRWGPDDNHSFKLQRARRASLSFASSGDIIWLHKQLYHPYRSLCGVGPGDPGREQKKLPVTEFSFPLLEQGKAGACKYQTYNF